MAFCAYSLQVMYIRFSVASVAVERVMPIFGDLRSMNNRRSPTHGAFGNIMPGMVAWLQTPRPAVGDCVGITISAHFRNPPEVVDRGSPLLPIMQAMNRGVAERLQGKKRGNEAISGVVLSLVLFAL